MEKNNWFIINEQAGNGRGKKVWNTILEYINRQNFKYQSFLANNQLQDQLYNSKSLPPDRIWIIGGDGTFYHCFNSILAVFSNPDELPPIAIIPAGTGNDLSRYLNIPSDPLDAFIHIMNSSLRPFDLISVSWGHHTDQQFALTVTSVGFDSQVAATVNNAMYKSLFNKLNLGKIAYYTAILQTIVRYQPEDVTVTIDGNEHHYSNVWLAAIANIPFYGSGLPIVPHASAKDGLLNLCIIHGCSKWSFPDIFLKIIKGAHVSHPNVTFITGKKISIGASRTSWVQANGEVLGHAPLCAEISESRVHLLY